jgi:hypothetical protein
MSGQPDVICYGCVNGEGSASLFEGEEGGEALVPVLCRDEVVVGRRGMERPSGVVRGEFSQVSRGFGILTDLKGFCWTILERTASQASDGFHIAPFRSSDQKAMHCQIATFKISFCPNAGL